MTATDTERVTPTTVAAATWGTGRGQRRHLVHHGARILTHGGRATIRARCADGVRLDFLDSSPGRVWRNGQSVPRMNVWLRDACQACARIAQQDTTAQEASQ